MKRSSLSTFSLSALVLAVFSISCNETERDFCFTESSTNVTTPIQNGISHNSTFISKEDALTVANIYLNHYSHITRSSTPEEPISIKDSKGETQLYAINFDGGHLLVPSTKAFIPIAAIIDGVYDDSVTVPAERLIVEEMCEQIARNRKNGLFEKYADEWRVYEKKNNDILSAIITKTSNPWEAYYDLLTGEWADRDVYFLSNAQGIIPNDIYQEFTSIVTQEYQNSTCVYPSFAVVTVEDTSPFYQKGPYTRTTWGQGYPYNSAVTGGYPLGCLTVAVSQLMRSVTLPAGILWSTMPDSGSNTYMSNFLAGLRTSLQIDTAGTGNINNAMTVLSGYGYNCSKQSHTSISPVVSSLSDRRLVIMLGSRKQGTDYIGHFWVCDGYAFSYPSTTYSLYILVPYGDDVEYYNIDSEEVILYNSAHYYFHMNWGHSGTYNGYFYEDDVEMTTNRDYCYYRKDLFVSNRYALYY